jgi:hypothetical protein
VINELKLLAVRTNRSRAGCGLLMSLLPRNGVRNLSAEPINGTRSQLLDWRKASRCQGNGDCVEVASASGQVAVRDSTRKDGPILMYSTNAWLSFLDITKRGVYDLPSLCCVLRDLHALLLADAGLHGRGHLCATIRIPEWAVSSLDGPSRFLEDLRKGCAEYDMTL